MTKPEVETCFVLTRRNHFGRVEFLKVSQQRERVMDGRRGPWRQCEDGHWTTAASGFGSEFMSPRSQTARTHVYDVREIPFV